jgi:hypothetical protein
MGIRLKVIPQQEDTDDLQAKLADDIKLFTDLAHVEVVPPVHGFATRPIIDT